MRGAHLITDLKKILKILAVRWRDSKLVTVASNIEGISPINNVSRCSQEKKRHILVKQPNGLLQYNNPNWEV